MRVDRGGKFIPLSLTSGQFDGIRGRFLDSRIATDQLFPDRSQVRWEFSLPLPKPARRKRPAAGQAPPLFSLVFPLIPGIMKSSESLETSAFTLSDDLARPAESNDCGRQPDES